MRSLVPGGDFRSSMNSESHKKKFAGVFVTASDEFFFFGGGGRDGGCLGIIVCAVPVRMMKDQY